jgi:hypothetical protein
MIIDDIFTIVAHLVEQIRIPCILHGCRNCNRDQQLLTLLNVNVFEAAIIFWRSTLTGDYALSGIWQFTAIVGVFPDLSYLYVRADFLCRINTGPISHIEAVEIIPGFKYKLAVDNLSAGEFLSGSYYV